MPMKGCEIWFQRRYIFAILGFLGITLQYVMKTNMSVGIVGMVKSQENESQSHSCPLRAQANTTLTNENAEFDWGPYQQGQVLSLYFIGYTSTQLLGGYLAQTFGGRWVVGPGVLITAVATFLTVIAARTNFMFLLITRFVAGGGSGVVIPGTQAMFSNWFPPEERQIWAGFVFSSIHFGSVAGMAIAGALSNFGWPAIFYGSGAMGAIWFVPWVFLAYDSPKTHPRISDAEKTYVLEGLKQDPNLKHKTPKKVPWRQILTSCPVWAAILFHCSTSWILYTELNEMPIYLNNILHVDKSGYISALPWLLACVSSIICGLISQKIRNAGYISHLNTYRIFNAFVTLGAAVCFVIIIMVRCDVITTIVMLVLIMFFNGFLFGGSYLNHLDLARNHAGAIAGILHTAINIPGFVTPLVAGAFIEVNNTIEQWHYFFYCSIGIACAAYIIYAFFGSVKEQPWNSYGVEDVEMKDEERNET